MKFSYFNPNPDAQIFKSGKPKSWNREDSSIRALCAATNNTWHEIFDKLTKLARSMNNMPDSKEVINEFCIENNFEYMTYGKPKVGEKRPLVKEFIQTHYKGIYILYLRNYYVCINNGILLNTVNVENESVYSFWKLK